MGTGEALLVVLMIGLGSVGAALVVRALVPLQFLLVKPFSCALCLSFYGCAAGTTLWLLGTDADHWKHVWRFVALLFPAIAVSVLLLKLHEHLSNPPPP